MRIALISHGFPPHAQGGAEIYAQAHARELVRSNDSVLIITREADSRREEYSVRLEQRDGMQIAWINNTFARARSFAETYSNEAITAAATGLIDEFRPDVAHVHHLTCLSTIIVRELAQREVPVFMTLHDYWLICHRGQLLNLDLQVCAGPEPDGCNRCLGSAAGAGAGAYAGRTVLSAVDRALPAALARPLRSAARGVAGVAASADRERQESAARLAHMRDVAKHVTHFFAPSRFMRDRFIAFGVDPSRITFSEYGVSGQKSIRDGFRMGEQSKSIPDGFLGQRPLRLGFLGSLMVSKAPHLLHEAVASLPAGAVTVDLFGEPVDYHGDASYRARLEPLLRHPAFRVRGKIDHDRVPSALAEMDALVVPSIWLENSPLVIREAFIAGVPVIASRIGGIPETVTHDVNGLLFEPGSSPALAAAIRRVIDEPDLMMRLRSAIPAVRTLEDDVARMRAMYATAARVPRARPRMSAVVLNYKTPDDTFLAVRSLLISSRALDDIFVVDNDASDDCRRALAPLGPRVVHIPAGHNRGFSGGVNLGIREALARGADRIVIVNSDVVVPVRSIEVLEQALQNHAEAGIVAPAVLARHAPDRVASMGIDYNRAIGRMRHRSVGASINAIDRTSVEADAVSGCLMLVSREVFDKIGFFDEDYFFGFEDVDFCLRASDAGFATIVAAGATALHEGGRSIGARSTRRLYFGARNQLLMAHRTSRASGRFASAGRAGAIVAFNVAHAIKADGGTVFGRLAAVGRGTLDYFRGRFGSDAGGRSPD